MGSMYRDSDFLSDGPADTVPSMAVVSNRPLRLLYVAQGFSFLGLAFVGIVLPLIPTVGPVLLAAFFFSRSSDRFDRWLLENRVFGGIVRDWRAGRGFTMRAKSVAIGAIAVTFTISIVFVVDPLWIRLAMVSLAASLMIYIARFPTKPPEPAPA